MNLITKAIINEDVTEAFALLRAALQLPERDAVDMPEPQEWRRMGDARRYDVVGHWLRSEALAAADGVTVFAPVGGALYARQSD